MTQHPITPPTELVEQWLAQHADYEKGFNELLIEAAQWGADQELETCCEWIADWYGHGCNEVIGNLRSARRPQPKSLKEKALDELHISFDRGYLKEGAADIIRRALEQLDD